MNKEEMNKKEKVIYFNNLARGKVFPLVLVLISSRDLHEWYSTYNRLCSTLEEILDEILDKTVEQELGFDEKGICNIIPKEELIERGKRVEAGLHVFCNTMIAYEGCNCLDCEDIRKFSLTTIA